MVILWRIPLGRPGPEHGRRDQYDHRSACDQDATLGRPAGLHRGWNGMIRAVGLLHLRDEAIALRMHRFQVAVGVRVVSQRLAHTGHGLADRGFADHRVAPHGIHELLARHEPITVANQVDEEIQRDRLEMNLLPTSGKPPRLRLDHEIVETVHRLLAHGLPVHRTEHRF